jgi:transcriptional regulator with XRE-family HTH domain
MAQPDPEVRARLARVLADLKVRGHTQGQIAGRLGLNESYFSSILHGRYALQPHVAEALEREFAVRADWLLTGRSSVPTEEADTTEEATTTTTESPDRWANVLTEQVHRCGNCRTRVVAGEPRCPYCGALLQWPGQ